MGYLLAAKSWLFIFLSEKKLKGQYALWESTTISWSDKDKYLACMSVAYMSSEESLSETAVSEWHEGNSSGSDEDLPNRGNLCVRPLSWQSIEVNGLMAQLDRKVAWCQSQ